jgi:dTDP-4-amino-4,6-dideoxygalactose transaminase
MKVQFMDMRARHAATRDELLRAIAAVIDSGDFCGDGAVADFEREFAFYCGSPHAITVANGTEALWLAMLAMGIGPGDEVITVSMTYAATAEAIRMAGAEPVFVDIDATTYTMNPAALPAALTPRTKAIVPVHLFGRMAEMAPIMDFASRHGLRVIEDAAQAHGAEHESHKAGSIGDAGCFSFYPTKNLAALGDGGAIITRDPKLAETLRMLRNHGQRGKNEHVMLGWNSRLDGIQAAALSIKLRLLDHENDLRRGHARLYHEGLSRIEQVICPEAPGNASHVHHIHAIRVTSREHVMSELVRRGIGCAVHYPVPLHLQPAFAGPRHPRGSLPVTEQLAGELLSLPMFPELTPQQIESVVQAVGEATGVRVAA